jgi:hypothetical protein
MYKNLARPLVLKIHPTDTNTNTEAKAGINKLLNEFIWFPYTNILNITTIIKKITSIKFIKRSLILPIPLSPYNYL